MNSEQKRQEIREYCRVLKLNAVAEHFEEAIEGAADYVAYLHTLLSAQFRESDQYEHAVDVLEKTPEAIVKAARKSEISINAAYQVTKMEPEYQQEVVERIENGEDVPVVVTEVRKKQEAKKKLESGNTEDLKALYEEVKQQKKELEASAYPVYWKMDELVQEEHEQEIKALRVQKEREEAAKPKPEPMPEGVISFQQMRDEHYEAA